MTIKNKQIVVKGARVHNLKNINVKIPHGKITVVTGLSGSGKSSLAFDTIFAEGQRRYVESLSSYTRHFFDNLAKPDVDQIDGLVPALSVDQKTAARTPRSTVATISELYDYFRLFFAKIGTSHCPNCETELVQSIAKKGENPEPAKMTCPKCEASFAPISMATFSFNSPEGACEVCQGLGKKMEFEPELIVPNKKLTMREGAIRPWSRLGSQERTAVKVFDLLDKVFPDASNKEFSKFTPEDLQVIFYGKGDFKGIVYYLEKKYKDTDSDYIRRELERYMSEQTCPLCEGKRLSQFALGVKVNGYNIAQVTDMPISEGNDLFSGILDKLDESQKQIASPIVRDIKSRFDYLVKVGLGYLPLNRSADTLSGGEAQRVRLATQLGSQLTGVLYVLDEPSMGLHPFELSKLIEAIGELRDNGNTVIIVEHDEQIIAAADYIIDIGPGAGVKGGRVVGKGDQVSFLQSKGSLTAQYLNGETKIEAPKKRRKSTKHLIIRGAEGHNLKKIDAHIPLESLVCVTGVSGCGKSTLIRQTLAKALARHFHRAAQKPAPFGKIEGVSHLNKVITVDQSPIGKTPRSNPATYTGVFAQIRELYAQKPLAKKRKYTIGNFSFNVKGGQCETCRGDGSLKYEMFFLPDVYVTCKDCMGSRYLSEVLDVKHKGKSIADTLNMTINEAVKFFADEPMILNKIKLLENVGLGYLQLGQSANTLSGGEAQRIKLAAELSRADTGKTLYILDEPTTGLHFEDTKKLLKILQALVDKGNTVLITEHNLDVIKSADWIIDLGPEGGAKGGEIVAEGTPEDVAQNPNSKTGQFLASYLEDKSQKFSLPTRALEALEL